MHRRVSVLLLPLLLIIFCIISVHGDSTDYSKYANITASICYSGATPFPLKNSTTCAKGWYCPLYNASNPETYPVTCAPLDSCMLDRVVTKFCQKQGTYEPVLCRAGYYCPTPTEEIECPEGHYCPKAQYEPIECGSFTSCPAGSEKKKDFSSLIVVVIADILCVFLYFAAMRWRRYTQTRRDRTYETVHLASVNASLYAKGPLYAQLPAHSKLLCQGFKRAQQQLPVMRLEFTELSLTIPAKGNKPALTILKGVTGSIEPGKVTAVMGPSGAGKTTFLNTMLGKADETWTRGGSLRINGIDEKLGKFRKIIGYVPQEDIMHRDLTVYENINYSAFVRLPNSWTGKQKEDHVNATISAMQLKHVQDTRIGDEEKRGVSGGQRKRCNIGMEVAAAPGLLLLDEPTSGLDSTAAMEICQVLKDLARVSSLTVCMVVHQPRIEIWNQLDELLLLAPGGLTVFQGPQRIAVRYFTQRFDVSIGVNENPADALMDRIAEQGDEFVRAWKDGGQEYVQRLLHADGNGVEHLPVFHVPDDDEPDNSDDGNHSEVPIDGVDMNRQASDNAANGNGAVELNNFSRVSFNQNNSNPPPTNYVANTAYPKLPAPAPAPVAGAAVNGNIPVANDPNRPPGTPHLIHVSSKSGDHKTNGNGNGNASAANGHGNGTSNGGGRNIGSIAVNINQPLQPPAFRDDAPLRETASFICQFQLAFTRSLWKQLANLPSLGLEMGLGCFAGLLMGALMKISYQGVLLAPYTILSPSPLEGIIGQFFSSVGLAISLAAASAGVSVFGEEMVIYRREISAGHNHFAYYLGVNCAQYPRLFLDGLHFAFLFHIQNQPNFTFPQFLGIAFLLYTAIYGLAFFVSMVVTRKNAALLGVVCSLMFSTMTAKGGIPEYIQIFSASRWAAEALFGIETKAYTHVMDVSGTASRLGYSRDRFDIDLFLMFLVGMFYRLIAYGAMRWYDRKLITMH